MNHRHKKKVVFFLVLLLVAMVLGFGIFFITSRLMDASPTFTDVHIDSEAALTLNLMKQVSKKNGITEWELEAATATLMKKQDQAVLTDVNVVFHTADNGRVFLTSDQGILDTRSHDMSFVGNVVVRHLTYRLKTDKLHYKKKPHIIYSDVPVWLADEVSVIQADTMEITLNKNTVTLQGHVEGRFSEKTALP
ncbi:MAG: LPS export ABC transporter periplasmic protein LptC [Desulfotignum sp.]